MNSPPTRPSRLFEQRFYAAAWMIIAVLVFWGFSRSYFLRPLFTAKALPSLLHIHGFLMASWILLFFIQARLIAAHRVLLHRRLGIFGAILAIAVLAAGVCTSIRAMQLGHVAPGSTPAHGLLVGLLDFLVFAGLVSAALLLRRRADYHKRLMLLAMFSLAIAGIGRLPYKSFPFSEFWQSGGPLGLFGLELLIPYAFIGWDTIRHRRLHPAFAWGIVWFVGVEKLLLEPIAGTPVWQSAANWILSL